MTESRSGDGAGADSRSVTEPGRHDVWLRFGAIALLLAGVVLLLQRVVPTEQAVAELEAWLARLGAWAPIAFGVVYVVATVLLLPGSALTLAGGAIFGLGLGTLTVSLASTTSAALCFLIARYFARDAVAARIASRPRFRAVDQAIGEGGWRIVALLRLSPAVPFNLQNYMYGLTSIRFWPCVLTSWVAMLPGTLLYVYLGVVGRRGLEAAAGGSSASLGQWTLLAVGLVATVAVTAYVTRLAKRALARRTEVGESAAAEPATAQRRRAVLAGLSGPTLGWLGAAAAILVVVAWSFVEGDAMRRAVAAALGL
jgi:uncharacterized membrane protein YdjX (TVP38/TMEM64 family)